MGIWDKVKEVLLDQNNLNVLQYLQQSTQKIMTVQNQIQVIQ